MEQRDNSTAGLDATLIARLDERYDHLATKYFVLRTVLSGFVAYTAVVLSILGLVFGVMSID